MSAFGVEDPGGGAVLFGVVVDSNDPDGMGRVQVRLASFSGDVTLPWIRVLQPLASNKSGSFLLPEKDDNVVILAGPGGPKGMVVLGCLYSGKRLPFIKDDGKNNKKQVYTRAGNEVTIDDTAGAEKITIQTKESKVKIEFDQAGMKLSLFGKTEVNVSSETKVVVTAKDIELTANAGVVVKGTQSVTVEGAQVEVKATGNVKVSGAMIELG